MARTRIVSSAEPQQEPPVADPMRGRGRSRGHARGRGGGKAQPRDRAAAPVAEPQVEFDDEVPAQTVPAGPAQVLERFLLEALNQPKVRHVYRKRNQVAHTLAKFGSN
uniref:Uncharacterized protein LOC104229138 n=1 Tax=Nicotiana sylvestris TaxID=4096 RepID=A0A1U7WN74_NICSY|nr:PREDICTED: uncharacterized protein LOC104229138 [Nicotiana sylvestris]XP_009780028.1 PREDICTED: uncharacterized protein LOC104229138 [Nicotiana sylvestris]